jgi:hypothetical protein
MSSSSNQEALRAFYKLAIMLFALVKAIALYVTRT